MAKIDPLLQRNKEFAATGAHKNAKIIANHGLYVISCLDPRTDPSAFLGIGLGDAMVVRNAGGRVSSGVLEELAFVCYLAENALKTVPTFEVAVIHHTQCGTRFLADDDFRRGFATRIDSDGAGLVAQAVTDPEQTVRFDVELLLSSVVLPRTISVSGHVYDVATGMVSTIIPATPMPAAAPNP